jgi:GT2 family glycosyltransferase
MPTRSTRQVLPQHRVTAVLVTHDGVRWLPEVLAALAAQVRPADRLVAVDTASVDITPRLLADAVGESNVVAVRRTVGFGAAVKAGLAHVGELGPRPQPEPYVPYPTTPEQLLDDPLDPVSAEPAPPAEPTAGADWIWLLHDDVAPEPDALLRMLEVAESTPAAAVIGPKVRDWDDPRLLVEVGLTIDHSGRRETGLERREYDQGQHDAIRDVLAVGTAGCLIRRDVWDELGGFDPLLPIFRDDIDLGWRANAAGHRVLVVPTARVRHARAAAGRRRRIRCALGRAPAIDRRHSLAVVLLNVSTVGLLWAVPRLVFGSLLRAIGFLLTRQVHPATDEVAALGWNLRKMRAIARARTARRPLQRVDQRELKHLFAARTTRLRGYLEAAGDWLTGGADDLPTGPEVPTADDVELAPSRRSRALAWLAQPAVLLVLALTLVALVADRGLYGGGRLVGGHLLPAPTGASDLWDSYFASWHEVGGGTAMPAPPWHGVLAMLATMLLGKAWLAVDLLMLLAVPLAALAAYCAARRVTTSRVLRAWAAVSYALLPPVTGAVAGGRLDGVVAAVLLPGILSACYRATAFDPRQHGWRPAFVAGLAVAVGAAFVPQLWLVAGLVLVTSVIGSVMVQRHGAIRPTAAGVIVLLVPIAALVPWSLDVVRHPSVLLSGLTAGSATHPLSGLETLLLHPGGAGLPPAPVTIGLLLAALAGLLRRGRRSVGVLGCWVVVIVVILLGAAVSRAGSSAGWAGPAFLTAGAALIGAAMVGVDDARERLADVSFGWRQPTAVAVAVVAALGPLVAAGIWVAHGAAQPLDRREVALLPRFVVARGQGQPGLRVLWLRQRADGVHYAVTGLNGGRLGDGQLRAPAQVRRRLAEIVADLASPRGSDAAQALATHAVRYVAVPAPVDPDLGAALDAQPALTRERVEELSPVRLWRVLAPAGRVTVLDPELAQESTTRRGPSLTALRSNPPTVLLPDPKTGRYVVPPGSSRRLVVISETRGGPWEATADRPLPKRTAWGWAAAFEVPPLGATVTVAPDRTSRRTWLGVQAGMLLVLVVLAAPSVRSGDEDDEPADVPSQRPVGEPAKVTAGGRA